MRITEAKLRQRINRVLKELFFMSLADEKDKDQTGVLKRALGASRPGYEDDYMDGGGYDDYGLDEVDEDDLEDDE